MLFNLVITVITIITTTVFIKAYHVLGNAFYISSPNWPCKAGIRAKKIKGWVGQSLT